MARRDIEPDDRFQRQEWRFQHVGRALLALLIAATATGALGGSGPLAAGHGRSADGGRIEVDYPRLAREYRRTELRVRVGDPHPAERVELWIERSYLDRYRVEGVTPEPASVAVTAERLLYRFEVERADTPLEVIFDIQATAAGRGGGRLGVGAESVELRDFVFP